MLGPRLARGLALAPNALVMLHQIALLSALALEQKPFPRTERIKTCFATSVCGIGDANGDSLPDFLVGDPGQAGVNFKFDERGQRGRAWLMSGADGSVLWSIESAHLDDGFGRTLSRIDDLNGDGAPDCVIGTSDMRPGNAGYVVIVCGRTGARIRTLHGEREHDLFGLTVEGLGDVDGDGVPDLAVGASLRDAEQLPDGAGELRVISGESGWVIYRQPCCLWVLDVGARPAIDVGDVNADGRSDFVVRRSFKAGGQVFDHDEGSFDVVSGLDWKTTWSSGPDDAASRPVSSADWDCDGVSDVLTIGDKQLRVLSGVDGQLLKRFDHSFAYAYRGDARVIGDLDQDNLLDIAMPNHTEGVNRGCVRALSGAEGAVLYEILGGPRRTKWKHGVWHFGQCMDTIGDLDGDGSFELVVGGNQITGGGLLWILDGATGEHIAVYRREGDSPHALQPWLVPPRQE